MARLTRKNIKVFAGNASNNGVFGSLQANNPTLSNDVEQIQSLPAWGDGWNAATETSEELPPLEEIQGVEYVTTYQQAYIMQEGLPEWASTVTYYKGSLVKEVTSGGFRIYSSLADNNTNNVLSNTSKWKKVMDSADLYAYDSAVVHNTGNEDVAGQKTFKSPLFYKGTSALSINSMHSTAIKGTAPSTNAVATNSFLDSSYSDSYIATIARTQYGYETSGRTYAQLQAFKPELDSTTSAKIGVFYPSSGSPYTETITPTEDNTTSTQIDTVGARNTKLANYVALTGNQTIGGGKTFTSNTYFQSTAPAIILKDTNYTKGTAPTSNNDSKIYFQDSAGTVYGTILNRVEATNLNSYTRIQTYKQDAGSSAATSFAVNYKANGEYYLTFGALSADSGDVNVSLTKNSTSTTDTTVPCMGWVNKRMNEVLSAIYPVGSVYIGTQSTCPMANLISGSTWTLVSSGKALWTGNGSNGNTTIAAGLPNITGTLGARDGYLAQDGREVNFNVATGAFTLTSSSQYFGTWDSRRSITGGKSVSFNANKSNSIYGNSSTVQPPAYVVNVWRRTA